MYHSWRRKTQGQLVPTMDDTYNSTINFKIISVQAKVSKRHTQKRQVNFNEKKERSCNFYAKQLFSKRYENSSSGMSNIAYMANKIFADDDQSRSLYILHAKTVCIL